MPPPMPMHLFNPLRFSVELFYTLLIMFLCFFIYYKTKELYSLTDHKGIYYFRIAFLLLGLTHLPRFIFFLLKVSTFTQGFMIPFRSFGHIFLVATFYLSTLALLYLIYSSYWKKLNPKYFIIFSNLFALILAVSSFFYRSPLIIGFAQLILFVVAFFIFLFGFRKKKRFSKTTVLYLFVLIFWLLSLFILVPNWLIPWGFDFVLYIVSLIVFLIIYRKVSKWTKWKVIK